MDKKEKHLEYVNDKARFAYDKYLKGEYFEKARAILVCEDKLVFLRNVKDGSLFYVGGGVDDGETLEEAVKREALEEVGMVITPIKKLETNMYNFCMEFEGKTFPSSRVEHIYLCECSEQISDVSGLEGEYEENGVEIVYLNVDSLSKFHLMPETIEKVKEYMAQRK